MDKEMWLKPRLVVIVRGKPEEAVLEACKTARFGAVADIATALQYKDANSFSRAFRGWARRPPSEWRAQAREG